MRRRRQGARRRLQRGRVSWIVLPTQAPNYQVWRGFRGITGRPGLRFPLGPIRQGLNFLRFETVQPFGMEPPMNSETVKRIEAYLKRTLNPGISLAARPRVTDS